MGAPPRNKTLATPLSGLYLHSEFGMRLKVQALMPSSHFPGLPLAPVGSLLTLDARVWLQVRSSRQALSRYRSTMKRLSSAGADGTGLASSASMVGNGTTQYAAIMTPPRPSVSKRELRLFLQFFIVSMVFLGTWVLIL